MEKFFKQIEKFFITTPVLNSVSKGEFFTKAFAWLLRICAALVVIGFIFFSVKAWMDFSNAFGGNGVANFFIMLIAELLVIAACYVIVNIFLIRSNNISALPLKTEYVVIPVAVQLIKMIGEIFAVVLAALGVFITLRILLSGEPSGMLDTGRFDMMARSSNDIVEYLAFAIMPVIGFLVLVFFYSIAELIGALVDIARNTKKK
jgi:hypothetical protein